ncbi:MAG: NUDIX domain-containing protein [Boseongicola sp.]|nr:MAG: NUDIX domain-containing protein [Boseongicola sp.]
MTATTNLFLYGTLRDPELLGIVAGSSPSGRQATLADHAVFWAKGEAFPIIASQPGSHTEGILIEADPTQKAGLDYYELDFGYMLVDATFSVGAEQIDGQLYVPKPKKWEIGELWSLSEWQAQHGALAREAAVEYMRLQPWLSAADAGRVFSQIRSRAFSRIRARKSPSPQVPGTTYAAADVLISKTSQPYTDYFAVREDWLQFPRYDGSLSRAVKRASFLGGDAVTVLPFDPKTEKVLAIQQFRHGALVRGDTNPWCLEPPAGRIDPGETAEEAALRELSEEAGLLANSLLKIAEYYPTSGAFSEHLTSFIARCDLDGRDAFVGGVKGEAEDILSHVMPLADLLEMCRTGQANTGPLIMSALWLEANRHTLGTE